MIQCPECREPLTSHAGRSYYYFHQHVIRGPYPNDEPHPCSLVNEAFTGTDTAIVVDGYREARRALVQVIHGHKQHKSND